MHNNPVENTKNTPKAAANSHRERGNFSALNFFPEGDSPFFSSSLSNSQLPVSTTTLRGAAIEINGENDADDFDNDLQETVGERWEPQDFDLDYNKNNKSKIGFWVWLIASAAAATDELKALRMRGIKSAQKSRKIPDTAEVKFTRRGIRNLLRDWKRGKFSNFELKKWGLKLMGNWLNWVKVHKKRSRNKYRLKMNHQQLKP